MIGRDPGCDLVLGDDDEVSRRHAALRPLPDGGVEIEDLGSRNGTYVEGDRLTAPRRPSGGEQIEVGMTLAAEGTPGAGETNVASKGETVVAQPPPPPPAPVGQPDEAPDEG